MDNADPHINYSYFHQARVLSPPIGVNESIGRAYKRLEIRASASAAKVKQTSSGRMGGGTVLLDPQSLYCETKPEGGLQWTKKYNSSR